MDDSGNMRPTTLPTPAQASDYGLCCPKVGSRIPEARRTLGQRRNIFVYQADSGPSAPRPSPVLNAVSRYLYQGSPDPMERQPRKTGRIPLWTVATRLLANANNEGKIIVPVCTRNQIRRQTWQNQEVRQRWRWTATSLARPGPRTPDLNPRIPRRTGR